jgi:hypothetical protein
LHSFSIKSIAEDLFLQLLQIHLLFLSLLGLSVDRLASLLQLACLIPGNHRF